MMLMIRVLTGLVTVAAIFAVGVVWGKDLGDWLLPVVLIIASIPGAIIWLLRREPAFVWRRPAAVNPAVHPIMFVVLLFIVLTLGAKFLGWVD